MSVPLAFEWTTSELAWAVPAGVVLAALIAAAASYFGGRRGSHDAVETEQLRIRSQHDLSDKERAERRRLSFEERMWDRKFEAYDALMIVCNQLTRSVMRAERNLFLNASDDLLRVVGPIAVLAPDDLLPAVNGLQAPVWKIRYLANAASDDRHFALGMTPAAQQTTANELVQMVGTLFALIKRDLARAVDVAPSEPEGQASKPTD